MECIPLKQLGLPNIHMTDDQMLALSEALVEIAAAGKPVNLSLATDLDNNLLAFTVEPEGEKN